MREHGSIFQTIRLVRYRMDTSTLRQFLNYAIHKPSTALINLTFKSHSYILILGVGVQSPSTMYFYFIY